MKLRLLIPVLLLAGASIANAQGEGDVLDSKDVPETVRQQVDCGTEADDVTRRAFAGGFVFAWRCPGNHANEMKALVFAASADGSGARLIRFPTPNPKKTETGISNVRWLPKSGEIAQLFVDPESRICRIESRWRVEGARAVLTHWRQTRDCKGRGGWLTLVNRAPQR